MMQKNEAPKKMKLFRILRYNVFERHVYGITGSFRTLPDFLVIGAKRCGTTSLYEYLSYHPNIKKSNRDHIGFFDDNFHLGLNYYRSFFPTSIEKKIAKIRDKKYLNYDVTSTYIHDITVAERVYHTLPNCKIIAILRNPIDRAYSEYNLHKEINPKIDSFESFIENEINNIQNNEINFSKKTKFLSDPKNYLKRGFWFEQLEPWYKIFPKKNILILSTEEFGRDSSVTFNRIFEFLNINKFSIENTKRLRKINYPKLMYKTRKKLIDFYKPYNYKFYNLVGENFDWGN